MKRIVLILMAVLLAFFLVGRYQYYSKHASKNCELMLKTAETLAETVERLGSIGLDCDPWCMECIEKRKMGKFRK